MKLPRTIQIAFLIAIVTFWNQVNAQECTQTFAGALADQGGLDGLFSDIGLFKTALDLSGYKDKLPPASLGVTLIIPNNKAWLELLWDSGFFIPSISKIGDQLPATVLYNVIPTPLSPDTIRAGAGELPTAFGLLGGGNFPLKYYTDAPEGDKPGAIRFQGTLRDASAKATRDPIQVCNSWIYIVDEVLYPADKLKNVQGVDIPSSLPWDNPPPPATPDPIAPLTTPTPEVVQPVAAAPAGLPQCSITPTNSIMVDTVTPSAAPGLPPTCSTTLVDAARSNSLNILSTLLAQKNVVGLLPNPATPNTLLAPTDAAFFNMMSKFNISLATAASSLGDILGSVLLYHVVPDYALSEEDIRSRAGLSTALAAALNDNTYFVGVVPTTDGTTTLTGLFPDNKAMIVGSTKVCETQVYLIDSVLVPGPSLDGVPPTPAAPAVVAPAPTAITPEALPAPVTTPTVPVPNSNGTSGSASNVGGLANCLVKLELPGGVVTAITDNAGKFTFPELVGCALQQAVAWLPAGVEQLESCIDSATQLPPPFTLTSFLDVLADGGNADSLLFTLSPLVSLLTRELEPTDTNLLTAPWMSDLAGLLGVSNPIPLLGGDYFMDASKGSTDSMSVLSANAHTLVTAVLGGTALSNLIPDISIEDASSTLLKLLGQAARSQINMKDPASIQSLLTSGLQTLLQQLGGGGGDLVPIPPTDPVVVNPADPQQTAPVAIASITSRKMLQDPVTAATPQVVDLAVGAGGTDPSSQQQQQPVIDVTGPVTTIIPGVTNLPTTTTTNPPVAAPAPAVPLDFNSQIIYSVSQPIAFLNGITEQACAAAKANPAVGADSATSTVQQVAAIAQGILTKAVADLSKGVLPISEFDMTYSPPNLSLMVYPMANAAAPVVAATAPSPSKSPIAPVSQAEGPAVAEATSGALSIGAYAKNVAAIAVSVVMGMVVLV